MKTTKEEKSQWADGIVKHAMKEEGASGAAMILTYNRGGKTELTVAMGFPADRRAIIPSIFRNIALEVEKQNLMAGIMTQPVNDASPSEVVHQQTVSRKDL